jgi:two-component system sensor histidine kinase RegB
VRATLLSFLEPPISADPAQNTAKLAWVIRLRWVALTAQLLSILPALEFGVLESDMLPLFLGVISVLSILNVISWAVLRSGRSIGPRQILLQLSVDIVALSALLTLTGGAWNPLAPILFVHSVLGALLLEGRLSLYFFALVLGCLLGIQALAHIPKGLGEGLLPPEILFPAQHLIAIVFWILTAWLSRTLTGFQNNFSLLRERNTRIDRLRAVGALAAGLSHEFATPLNTATLKVARLARTHALADDPDLATAAEALDRCGDVLKHMAGTQLDPERLQLETVDVDELVERVCSAASNGVEGLHVEFRRTGTGTRRATLPAIPFSQALLNLIDNAAESGAAEDLIEVVVASRAGRIEVSVLDRGAGWPDVVRNHLGEPFVTTKPDGVGLGLYFVHSLSQAVGADLLLEDRADGGAVARISLPIASIDAEAAA